MNIRSLFSVFHLLGRITGIYETEQFGKWVSKACLGVLGGCYDWDEFGGFLSSSAISLSAVKFDPQAQTYVFQVVLPTFILERRSLLEMYADFFAHPDLFVRYLTKHNSFQFFKILLNRLLPYRIDGLPSAY